MYQQRFRHRNVLQPDGNNVQYQVYNTSSCTVTPTWAPYFTATPGVNYASIAHMDDISGDRPTPSQGPSGYKFHPMSQGIGEFSGNGSASWLVRNTGAVCDGTPQKFYNEFRRVNGTQNASRFMAGLEFPMIGDRIDAGAMLPSAEVSRLQGLVQTAVLAKRGKYGESNLYESLAEVDKSIGMLKGIFDTARSIQDAIFFKKGGVAKLRSLSKDASSQYLATRYGFAPLVKDLEAILVGLERTLGSKLVKSVSKEVWRSTTNTALSDLVDADTVSFTRNLRTDKILTVKAISLDDVVLTRLGVLGLGVKDLLSAPWELTHFSFVIDWIINAGDFLNSLVPDIGISNVGQCIVTEYLQVDTVSYGVRGLRAGRETTQTLVSSSSPPAFTRSYKYKDRQSVSFTPSLHWQSDFKFNKLLRTLDAYALLVQQTSKVKAKGWMDELTELEKLMMHRRRNPSRKGVRSTTDFRNLSD